jgi:hypothetical protein
MRFRVESASPELPIEPFDIELASGNVVSFVGYNATLKSLTARALLYELCQVTDRRTGFIKQLGERSKDALKILKLELFDKPKGVLPYLVDDHRLSLRAYLSMLEEVIDRVKNYVDSITEERLKGPILSELNKLRYNIAPQLKDYIEMKKMHDSTLFHRAMKVSEEKLEEVSKRVAIDSNLLLPLEIEIVEIEIVEPEIESMPPRPEYYVRDKRLGGKNVSLNLVSTTIAAALLWKLTLYFFSIPSSARVFVVEEPEEAMTPLQQIAYVETLKTLAREMPGENYVVLTTHSPYIAGASDQPSYYFSFENGKFTCEPATIPPPMAKADTLLLLKSIEK